MCIRDSHRTVKKGEKGIKILAPAPYKVKQKIEKLDEQGKPVLDKDGKPLTEEKTEQIPAFKDVYKRQAMCCGKSGNVPELP